MRTNIEIDDEVMREAQRLTGVQTKRETVDLALRELVARHRRLGILDLRGRVHWEGDLGASRRGRAGSASTPASGSTSSRVAEPVRPGAVPSSSSVASPWRLPT